jgi:hypothetical protein
VSIFFPPIRFLLQVIVPQIPPHLLIILLSTLCGLLTDSVVK